MLALLAIIVAGAVPFACLAGDGDTAVKDPAAATVALAATSDKPNGATFANEEGFANDPTAGAWLPVKATEGMRLLACWYSG